MSNETPTRKTEKKIRAPPDFNGDRTAALLFLATCVTYLRINSDFYEDDEAKIIFVLSYMTEGTATAWKASVLEKAYTEDEHEEEKGFGTWKDFVKDFKAAFFTLNPTDDAIATMKTLKQTGTADDYIAAFRPLAISSRISQVEVLADYFLTGLNNGLVRSIMSASTMPKEIEEYYTLAARLDLQWRKGQAIIKGTTTTSKKPATTTQSSNSNNGRRINLTKLTEAERAQYLKEGRCFRCRQTGHMAKECPQNTQNPPPRRQIKVVASTPNEPTPAEPETAIGRMRALYATLTPAEKEEVVNIAEAEGF